MEDMIQQQQEFIERNSTNIDKVVKMYEQLHTTVQEIIAVRRPDKHPADASPPILPTPPGSSIMTRGHNTRPHHANNQSSSPKLHESAAFSRLPRIDVSLFTGDNVEGWLFQIGRYFEQHAIPIDQRILIATFSMCGEALKWLQWMHATHQIGDWSTFVACLVVRFGSSLYWNAEVMLNKVHVSVDDHLQLATDTAVPIITIEESNDDNQETPATSQLPGLTLAGVCEKVYEIFLLVTKKLDCRIELDRRCTGASSYIVTVGDAAFDITVISRPDKPQPVLKDWLLQIRRLYLNQKKQKICVGIGARKRNNIGGPRRVRIDGYYQMLQLCVGDHCLLIEIEPYAIAHPSVKDFIKRFFTDNSCVFVGVGFKDVLAKIYKEYEDTDFKGLLSITNVIDLRELAARDKNLGGYEKCGLEKLVKVVLDVEYDTPTRMGWYAEDGSSEFSDELVLWSSVEVFLIAKMGMAQRHAVVVKVEVIEFKNKVSFTGFEKCISPVCEYDCEKKLAAFGNCFIIPPPKPLDIATKPKKPLDEVRPMYTEATFCFLLGSLFVVFSVVVDSSVVGMAPDESQSMFGYVETHRKSCLFEIHAA